MSSLRLFVHTWRSLRRVPVYRTTIVLTLAIGMGAAAMTSGLVLSSAGVVPGVALSLATTRFLRASLFAVAPSDPITLRGAAATLVAFAVLASWIPARRAAQVDPTESLRAD